MQGARVESPKRLVVLDGMRGVAALTVLAYHAVPLVTHAWPLPRGYLAVDFFFMLSGFVMARTYESRLAAGLGARTFIEARVRRLWPVMAIGIALGAIVMLAGGEPPAAALLTLATELLFVPTLDRGYGQIFALNSVQWSLFFELFANLVHALLLHRLSTRALAWSGLVAFVALAIAAACGDGLNLGSRSMYFAGGVPRVLFPYIIGILLARRAERSAGFGALPGWLAPALLVAVIAGAGLAPDAWPRWTVDLAVVALAFPALIVLGVRSRASPAATRWMEAAGALSYPLYAVHLPVILLTMLVASGALGTGPAMLALCLFAAIAAGAAVQALVTRKRGRAPATPQAISRIASA